METLYTTREAAPIISASGIFPTTATPLTQRSVARLCKRGMLTGAYLVQGDWCIPQSAIDAYIELVKTVSAGRPPRIKKTA